MQNVLWGAKRQAIADQFGGELPEKCEHQSYVPVGFTRLDSEHPHLALRSIRLCW
jgi:hypothetical protein